MEQVLWCKHWLLLALLQASEPGPGFHDLLPDGTDAPQMLRIPAGTLRMGSAGNEIERAANEGPQRTVAIGRFAIARTELTVGQFRQFVAATGYRSDAERNLPVDGKPAEGCYTFAGNNHAYLERRSWRWPGFEQGDDHPAVCLSWNDARAYVSWLSNATGQRYRLPSEAELEYLIRAGSTTAYAFGASADEACRHANVRDQSVLTRFGDLPVSECGDGAVFTSPVARYRPNAFGLFDTVGNAWEWTADCWHPEYVDAPADASAWTSGHCEQRVLRGGGWFDSGPALRSANRSRYPRSARLFDTGMRVAREW